MHFLFSLLGIMGRPMFRALLAHPQEVLQRIDIKRIPSAVCEARPEDEQVMFETCRGP
jgi:hypothetical protein